MMYTSDSYNNNILFWTIALGIPIGPLYSDEVFEKST